MTDRDKYHDARVRLGCSYDLIAALEYNQPQAVDVDEIEVVVAELTGENDERNWHWLVRLYGARWGYITGGCDFTGWDCQSSCHSSVHSTRGEALADVPEEERRVFEEMLHLRETTRAAIR